MDPLALPNDLALIPMSKHYFFLTTYDAYILYYAHFGGLFSCIKIIVCMENLNLKHQVGNSNHNSAHLPLQNPASKPTFLLDAFVIP